MAVTVTDERVNVDVAQGSVIRVTREESLKAVRIFLHSGYTVTVGEQDLILIGELFGTIVTR